MMIQRLLPSYLAKNAYEIPASFYKGIGKKIILFDLDNTLDPIDTLDPSSQTKSFILKLKQAGLTVYIASNNTSKRVFRYSKALDIEAISGLFKPFSIKLKKWLKKKGYSNKEVILIGDQLFTDVLAANGAKIDVILTEPISKKDSVFTFFNRKIEKAFRKKIRDKHLANNWEEIHL